MNNTECSEQMTVQNKSLEKYEIVTYLIDYFSMSLISLHQICLTLHRQLHNYVSQESFADLFVSKVCLFPSN